MILCVQLCYTFRDPKAFQATCYKTKTTDDLTIGAIISNINVILMELVKCLLVYSNGTQL